MAEPFLHPDVPDSLRARVEARQRGLAQTVGQLVAGRDGFVWEIGCGNGHWLVDYAAAHPEAWCVGIDLIGFRIERSEAKRRRAALENVRFLKAEAWEFLQAVPAEIRIGSTVILYPDPWPKKRHWKNRLVDARFLVALAARTQPGGFLFFRTDHEPYHAAVVEALGAVPSWARASEDLWPLERETLFQARTARDGRHSLVARRV